MEQGPRDLWQEWASAPSRSREVAARFPAVQVWSGPYGPFRDPSPAGAEMQVAGTSAEHTTRPQLARPGGAGCCPVLGVSWFDGSSQLVAIFWGLISLLLFVVFFPRGGEEEERLQLRGLTSLFPHLCV